MIEPVLGYPSRTAAVEALLAQGLTRSEIAAEIGGTENAVQMLIYSRKRRLTDRKMVLPRAMVDALAAEAMVRGVSPTELALQLLEVIVRDELFDPLLGECEARHG